MFKKGMQKGFTLVELMIVVAIIGILAAIAIPQFAQYRVRGFNTSALSDVKNVFSSEAALFADWQRYGVTQANAGAFDNTIAAAGTGAAVLGGDANGDGLATSDFAGNARGSAISVGNGITIFAIANVQPQAGVIGNAATFQAAAKHQQGDTTFAVDADSTVTYQNTLAAAPVGTALTTAFYTASVAANTVATDDIGALAPAAGWVAK